MESASFPIINLVRNQKKHFEGEFCTNTKPSKPDTCLFRFYSKDIYYCLFGGFCIRKYCIRGRTTEWKWKLKRKSVGKQDNDNSKYVLLSATKYTEHVEEEE